MATLDVDPPSPHPSIRFSFAAPSSPPPSARRSNGTIFSSTAPSPASCSQSCFSRTPTPGSGTLEAFGIYCGRLRRAPDRRRHFRPLRRPHRPQVDADRDAAADGTGDLRGRAGADLRKHRHLGRGHPHRAALHPGHRRRRRMGRLGADVDGMGAHRPTRADSSRHGRSSACPAGCSSPISRCSRSARCRASSSWPGAGASRSRSACCWSGSASTSGWASWKRRCSPSCSPSARSTAPRC